MASEIYAPVNNITAWLVTQQDASDPAAFTTWLLGELPEGYTVQPGPIGGLIVYPPEGDSTPSTFVNVGQYAWVHEGKLRCRPQEEFECYYTAQ
jgi:hypothetical protein